MMKIVHKQGEDELNRRRLIEYYKIIIAEQSKKAVKNHTKNKKP